jgi:hypothetical protein
VAPKTVSGDEAAAVAAAIARFEAEFAAGAGEAPEAVNRWQRAALIEGVSAKESVLDDEGGSKWLS